MKTIISRISRFHRSILWMGAVAARAPVGLFAAGELAADWNGDGRADLLVGDFQSGGNQQYHGWVWVYLRTSSP